MNKQDCGFIYTQYCDKVFGFVRSKIFNQTEAEDIVQTVFLKVYSNLDKYDETKASLSTWIYTITRNTVYDYLKEKRDHPVLELMDNTVYSADEPEDSILNNEALEELACALEKLPQDQRDIIILVYYKNLDRRKVAGMFGMTYGQLRYLHDKAMKRLGELLHKKRITIGENHVGIINVVHSAADGGLDGVSDAITLAMSVVCGLLIVVSIFALGVWIFLAISYVRYNKKQNGCGKTGEQLVLDGGDLAEVFFREIWFVVDDAVAVVLYPAQRNAVRGQRQPTVTVHFGFEAAA